MSALRGTHNAGLVCIASSLSLLLCATPVFAQDMRSIFGDQQKPHIDPAGFFAVILPGGFDCQTQARKVVCQGNRGMPALLTIDVLDVPISATAELVLLNEMARLKKKPHFKLISKRKEQIDNGPAMLAAFNYDHNGNVELSVAVQQLYIVRGGKEYFIHYESSLGGFGVYQKDLRQVYGSLRLARLDGGGNPIVEDLRPRDVKNDSGAPELDRALKGGY